MTSKQRSNLKSIAATLKPIAQVGKEGVSDNLLKSLSDALEAHELIKLNLLPASGEDEDALAASIASALSAAFSACSSGEPRSMKTRMTEYNSPGPKLKKWQSTVLVKMRASTMKARKIFSLVRRFHKSRTVWNR